MEDDEDELEDMLSNASKIGSWLLVREGVWIPLARFLSSQATLFRLECRIGGSLVDADRLRLPPLANRLGDR